MNKLWLISFIFIFLFLFGCTNLDLSFPEKKEELNLNSQKIESIFDEQTKKDNTSFQDFKTPELKKFSSYTEMLSWLQKNSLSETKASAQQENIVQSLGEASKNILQKALPQSREADFSKTNVQVEGIDEPDIVKVYNSHLFVAKEDKIFIISATKQPKIVFSKKLNLKNPIINMFVDGDYLILFSQDFKKSFSIEEFDFAPYEVYVPYVLVQIYNVSDLANPILFKELSFLGDFTSARLKNNNIYLVSTQENYVSPYPSPWFKEGEKIFYNDIYYFDVPIKNPKLSTISIFSLDGNVLDSKTFLTESGFSNTMYMSDKHIYLAIQKPQPFVCRFFWCSNYVYQINKTDRFTKAILPHLPFNIKGEIEKILSSDLDDSSKWQKIEPILRSYLEKFEDESKVSKSQLEEFKQITERIYASLAEYDAMAQIQNSQTFIYKFSFENNKITLKSSNYINGYLLNQWAMDEYNDYLRVVSTIDVWARKNIVYNNIYIFDKDLKVVSMLDKIAPGEKVYSARFMGGRLYLVTYKKVDPFFVIDLSSPSNPKVLGYLKIPGYLTYLHPYNDSVILGIGQMTKLTDYDFEVSGGLKVELIDISNPTKPKVLDSLIIGDEGTSSPVLQDHKAFVFNTDKLLLYLPLKVVEKTRSLFYDKTNIFYGVYVLNLKNGEIKEEGKIPHHTSSDLFYLYDYDYYVRRVAYISNYLFSVSNKYIVVSNINDSFKEIEKFSLD